MRCCCWSHSVRGQRACARAAQAQASAAVNAVVARPDLVTNWLKQVKLPNYMQLKNWVAAFPPAAAAVPPPQQAPPQQQVRYPRWPCT